jgi:hypothetical protein
MATSETPEVRLSNDDLADWFADVDAEAANEKFMWPYVTAAAVLSSFDPDAIEPAGGVQHHPEEVSRLLELSKPLGPDHEGRVRWQLNDETRRAAIRRLGTREALQRARAANAHRGGDDSLQRALDELLEAKRPPLGGRSLDDLIGLQRAASWLSGVRGCAVPDARDLAQRIARERVLKPMRGLAGEHFVGREAELARLSDYVGVRPSDSLWQYVRRGVKYVTYLMDSRPPLFFWGPGGVGKSTLLARFILQHADPSLAHPLPFVYLDFDRATLDPRVPDTLVAEAIRQIEAEFPDLPELERSGAAARRERFTSYESVDVTKSTHYGRSSELVGRFLALLRSVAERNGQPVLLVLDTFEEARMQGESAVSIVWDLLRRLLEQVDRLRIVVAGRTALTPSHPHEPLQLPAFEEPSAMAFLRRRTERAPDGPLSDHDAREIIQLLTIRQEDGSKGTMPLSLALAARIVLQQGLAALQESITRQGVFARISAEEQQGLLNARILQHLHGDDPNLQKIADPGLLVRRITPDVIREVLAGPCKLDLPAKDSAQKLFGALAAEVTLVDAQREPGALWHLSAVRRVMLPALRRRLGDDLTREIHEAAIAFYAAHADEPAPVGDTARIEEMYHRLCAGQPQEELDRRWRPGLEGGLRSAYDEIEGPAKLWLATRLGREVDEELRRAADLQGWEQQAALRARTLMDSGMLVEALAALRERPERSPASSLPSLEADVLTLLGRDDEARRVIMAALDRGAIAGRDDLNAALLIRLSTLEERAGRLEPALQTATEAARAARTGGDAVTELGCGAAILRLRRKLGRVDDVESQRVQQCIKSCVARPDVRQSLRKRPAVLREVAAEMALELPDVLADALEIVGIDRAALGALVADLHAALLRATGGKGELFETVARLMRREANVTTAGLGRELAALVRRLRDRDLVGAIGRSYEASVEGTVTQVIADRGRSAETPAGIEPAERTRLVKEIARTFDAGTLEEFIYLTMDRKLGEIVPAHYPVSQMGAAAVDHFEKAGELPRLLNGIVQWPTSTPDLRTFAASLLRKTGGVS